MIKSERKSKFKLVISDNNAEINIESQHIDSMELNAKALYDFATNLDYSKVGYRDLSHNKEGFFILYRLDLKKLINKKIVITKQELFDFFNGTSVFVFIRIEESRYYEILESRPMKYRLLTEMINEKKYFFGINGDETYDPVEFRWKEHVVTEEFDSEYVRVVPIRLDQYGGRLKSLLLLKCELNHDLVWLQLGQVGYSKEEVENENMFYDGEML